MKLDQIICGDNLEVMRGFPDACIDLTVTSPPYDNLRAYNGYSWDFENVAKQLYRVTKSGGVVVWVVGDATVNGSETGTSFRQALYFMECGFNLHDTMIYTVPGTGAKGSTSAYWQGFEYMFVLSKGKLNTFNPIADHKNKTAGAHKDNNQNRNGTRLGAYSTPAYSNRMNVWEYAVGSNNIEHPAPFPEALARDHIRSWSNSGDLVLDPFIGSGTTAKMAKETGRHWIGIDCSAEYCKLAEKRVAGANVPLFL